MGRIREGDAAPDVTLKTHTGRLVSLSAYRGCRPVVIFFYPRDGTPVCTRQACAFRDAYADFTEAGAVVIGVSANTADRHHEFAAEHELPYMLADDSDGRLRKAFGVPRPLGVIPGRVTYVIDRDGIVRHITRDLLHAERHIEESLQALQGLENS